MGQIGRCLDRLCADYPEYAEALLTRPFSRLSTWVDDNGCGCGIGTAALAAGFAPLYDGYDGANRDAPAYLEGVTGLRGLAEVGLRINDMSARFAGESWRTMEWIQGDARSDALVSRLIRTRVAVTLATREVASVGA